MQYRFLLALSSFSLLFISGCWDRAELTEYAFVQAVAFDNSKEGKIAFTSLFYKPSSGSMAGGGGNTRGSFQY